MLILDFVALTWQRLRTKLQGSSGGIRDRREAARSFSRARSRNCHQTKAAPAATRPSTLTHIKEESVLTSKGSWAEGQNFLPTGLHSLRLCALDVSPLKPLKKCCGPLGALIECSASWCVASGGSG